jgi:hypothetical protein
MMNIRGNRGRIGSTVDEQGAIIGPAAASVAT